MMLRDLRGPSGGPNLRVRLLAVTIVAGLVLLTAPLVVIPILRALADLVAP